MDANPSPSFPHLNDAPIVEAIIDWRARAETWNPDGDFEKNISEKLRDYPSLRREHSIDFIFEMAANKPPELQPSAGLRFQNAVGNQIAKFTRNGFGFSRLKPYPNWEYFETEGRRLWKIFFEFCRPSEIQRLGVRFVNGIPITSVNDLRSILKEPPAQPLELELPLLTFTYQSKFDAPRPNGMAVNITKTIQEKKNGLALILDIDVFTKEPIICDDSKLDDIFPVMRHLKNRAFFSLLTDKAIAGFRGKTE